MDNIVKFEFGDVNVTALKEQKAVLIKLQCADLAQDDFDKISGIINLIDEIQDYACDILGIPEDEVFTLNDVELRAEKVPFETVKIGHRFKFEGEVYVKRTDGLGFCENGKPKHWQRFIFSDSVTPWK